MSDILTRKRKTKAPCPGCGLHLSLCICELIPLLDLKTRVCLVIHDKELKRTTNSGRLALRSLVNSEMKIGGVKEQGALDLSDLLVPTYRTLLFYPSEDAQELTREFVMESPLPIQLIVPDGNWRQASKVASRHPELRKVPRVKISSRRPGNFHLRAEHMNEGMATLEAIALALGIIEGPEVEEKLFSLYEAKLKNTLRGRGVKI